ncbi:MAG TPA: amidase [Actinomycetales bacterium]|nr:amidase [Actinomycetales bacterium]
MTSLAASETLLGLDLVQAARLVADGTVDPVDLTSAYLDRLVDVDGDVGAYVTVAADRALDAARAARVAVRQGRPLGALHGLPLGVKDLFDTAGVRTTYGSALYVDHVPTMDATVVARLREAGAVLLGKHATHELAWGGTTSNEHFGVVHNPRRTSAIPGGSSGGSAAAVVSGTAIASVGTDTAGSVRIPAAACGCVGLKPSRGRVSLAGAMPLARSLDHAGPITRTVADAALLLKVIAGADERDPRTLDDAVPDYLAALAVRRRVRVGRLRGWYDALLDDAVREAVDVVHRRLTELGHEVVDVDAPGADAVAALFTRLTAEAGALHQQAFRRRPEAFGSILRRILGRALPTPSDLAAAEGALARQSAALFDALAGCDVLLTATLPMVAPPIGSETVTVSGTVLDLERALTRLTSVFDVSGLPALSLPLIDGRRPPLPVDPASDGPLPVGVQLVGRPRDEVTVLQVGHELERALGGDEA